MKKILYLALVLIMPIVVSAEYGKNGLEGYWYSNNSNYELRIQNKAYGLKVKGLPGSRSKWKKFRPTNRHNVYKDSYGNLLVRRSRSQINYETRPTSRRRGSVSKVYRFRNTRYRQNNGYRYSSRNSNSCPTGGSYGNYNDGYYSDYRDDYPNEYREDYRDDYRNDYGVSPRDIVQGLRGSWITVGLENNRRVTISPQGNGISIDNNRFYAQEHSDPTLFVDNRGYTYRLESEDTLVWRGATGRDIVFKRY